MNLCSLFAGTSLATLMVVLAASTAAAAPIDFGGYTGSVTIKYANYEDFTTTTPTTIAGVVVPAPAAGSDNYGIFAVTSALANDQGSNILNQSLYTYVGVFNGVTTVGPVTPFTAGSGGGFDSVTTGGTFELFQIPNANINLTNVEAQGGAGFTTGPCGGPSLCYNGITNAAGATLVLEWTLGTNSINPDYEVKNPVGGLVNKGSAGALATIIGGTDASQFGSILSIEDDFCFNNGTGTGECGLGIVNASNTANNFQLLSQDPVTATLVSVPVPEPASVALFGAGFLGLAGLFGWRRRKSA